MGLRDSSWVEKPNPTGIALLCAKAWSQKGCLLKVYSCTIASILLFRFSDQFGRDQPIGYNVIDSYIS